MTGISRRQFLTALLASAGLATLKPAKAAAFGEESHLSLGLLRYEGGRWNPRPSALQRLLLEVELTTSVLVDAEDEIVDPTEADLVGAPLTFVAGDRGFPPFSEEAREALRRYTAAGGILVFDSSEGRIDGQFRESVERELSYILPDQSLSRISDEHVILKSFYLCNGDEGRVRIADYLEGVESDGHLAAVFCHNDLMGAWARDNFGNYEYQMHPGGEEQRQMAYRLGINIVMYALCLDYKEDQVHVPFILRRRRWRVE
jgi:hypothetical protein